MKNITRHVGTLSVVKRLPSSVNGNPRYLIGVDGYLVKTAPDSSIAFEVTNFDGKEVIAEIGTFYGVPTLHRVESAPAS